ncbi:hypothetical protein POJ06DRAFT_146848 [Lipomyces tetrasporus]|uniref:Uncharacterized protein n=1 Tax=Lipomyces tetrasporus TaxID=54092 RepID=A0AAD7QN17_9ASCO|nr:uncharacterized protein POJ06DRAFT_146848 [Lipomyces tetrasporus]KAJ8098204.1 hypothetical protein POJ06DRAFT_146848 [Lipomyces tetrasporus]
MALQLSTIENSERISLKSQPKLSLSESAILESPYTSTFFFSTITLSVLGCIIFLVAITIFFVFAFAIVLFVVFVLVATVMVVAGSRYLEQHISVLNVSSNQRLHFAELHGETSTSADCIRKAPFSQLRHPSSMRSQHYGRAADEDDYELTPTIETDAHPKTDGSVILLSLLLAPTDVWSSFNYGGTTRQNPEVGS